MKDNDFIYFNDSNDKIKNIGKDVYQNFFEDFKLIIENNQEIKKLYLPELLFFKYLCKLLIII